MPLRRSPPTGLRRLRRHVVERRGRLALLLGCAMVEAFAQSGSWLLVRLAINEGIVPGDEDVLAFASAAYLAVSLTGWALFGFVIRGMARFGQELVLGLRRELFDHLTSLSLRYFSEQRAGWIIARLTSDVDAISDVLSQGLPTLVTNAVLLPAAITALFINDWRLALVALVVLPPALVLTRWFQRVSSAAQLEVRNRIAIVTAHLAESVAGMAVVQSFRRESAFQARFDELNADNRDANVVAQRISSLFFPSIEFLGVVATVAVLAVGADVLPTSEIGTLAAAYFLLQLVFQPLQELSDIYSQLQSATAAMVKVSAVLDTETDLREIEHPLEPGRLDGELRFESVHFAYGAKRVLHGIDLVVPPGGCTALVGESGGGKSTMAKLVARFYDPLEGSVRVDGIDLRELDLQAYRRQLGVVLQDPFLFSGTIASNIRFARPEATDDEVRRHRRATRARPARAPLRRGPRPPGARGRQRALGRRAPADLDRAGAARRPADPDPRRGDLEHRPPDRAADRARARPAAAGPHLDHHRPPALDRPPRRRDRGRRPREDRPAGHGGRAAGLGRALPAARAHAGGVGDGRGVSPPRPVGVTLLV